MILKKLYLKNFLIHDNSEISFSEKGITVFIGENGAGKSSILEGLTFALFGKSEKGNQANLVKWGRNQASVILDFQKGDNIYRIERVITLKGNKASSIGTVYIKKGERFVPYFQKNITKEIPKLTGITNKIFSSSILVKQGDIEGLLKLTPKERGKVLEEILDMTLYQLL
ncbi:MAG: AAA family ATPase, partial [Aquificae bacterium]|nr:AAA family ATPase [Aquificota bacterium]